MSNKHDLPIAAHAVIMTRGPVLRLAVRDDVADEVACQYRNNGVDCDVVQLVRHSDAIAAIQRLEAENEELKKDAERLDWMISAEAHVGWNREGDSCRVHVPSDDPIDGYVPACGWSKFFADGRSAIDAALTKEQKE